MKYLKPCSPTPYHINLKNLTNITDGIKKTTNYFKFKLKNLNFKKNLMIKNS